MRKRCQRDPNFEENGEEEELVPKHRLRQEVPFAIPQEIADVLAPFLKDFQLLQPVVSECFRILCDAWIFDGQIGDCFDSIRSLDPLTVIVLQKLAHFRISQDADVIYADRTWPPFIVVVARLLKSFFHCGHFCSLIHFPSTRITTLAVSDAGAFGWENDENTLPCFVEELVKRRRMRCCPSVCAFFNAMLTDGGLPNLAHSTGTRYFACFQSFGKGFGVLVDSQVFKIPRKVQDVTFGSASGLAVMLSVNGPLVVQVTLSAREGIGQLVGWLEDIQAHTPATSLLVCSEFLSDELAFELCRRRWTHIPGTCLLVHGLGVKMIPSLGVFEMEVAVEGFGE